MIPLLLLWIPTTTKLRHSIGCQGLSGCGFSDLSFMRVHQALQWRLNLARIADEALATRRNFLARVVLGDSSAIVVSDEESFEYCSRQGNQVLLSPPPFLMR